MKEGRYIHIAGWPYMAADYYMQTEWADILEPLDMQARVQAFRMLEKQERDEARQRAGQAILASSSDSAERTNLSEGCEEMTEPRASDVLLWCLFGFLVIMLVAVLVSPR
jgi:hypothetical protein